jgi:NitT/TauT family transport system permease protein
MADHGASVAVLSADKHRPVPGQRRDTTLRTLTRYLSAGMLPLATSLLLVLGWVAVVRLGDVPEYVLPAPQDVLPRIVEDRHLLWGNSLTTLTEIVAGFFITIVTAIPIGLVFALSTMARRALYPLVVVIQLIPKIAVAPLFLVWFGFGQESKIFLVVLLTFFPLLLASMTGFRVLDERYLYLTRSMGASTWQTFRHLRFPAAMPVIFSGMKTSATLATTGAIVAEFVGANRGLGYQLLRATSTMDTEMIFAIIVVLTLIGVFLNGVVEAVEYMSAPWQRRSGG